MITRDKIREIVYGEISDYLADPEANNDNLQLLRDLDMRSLDFLRLQMRLEAVLEEHYNVKIDMNQIKYPNIKEITIREIIDEVENLVRIAECTHDRLTEEGVCRTCGRDCRGIH